MAIIGKVEKKNWKVKLLNISIHIILIIGASTMVYPLLIMISGSFKSDVDFFQFSVFPEYVYDNTLLYQKYLKTKYNGKTFFPDFRLPPGSITNLKVPDKPSRARMEDYRNFLEKIRREKPHYWHKMGMTYESGVGTLTLREYRAWLEQKFGTGKQGIDALNEAYHTDYSAWESIELPNELFEGNNDVSYSTPLLQDVKEFKGTQLSLLQRIFQDLDGYFIARQRAVFKLPQFNEEMGTDLNTWSELHLPVTAPKNANYRKLWSKYVRTINPAYLYLNPEAKFQWQEYLRKKYSGNVNKVNQLYKNQYKTFLQIPLPERYPDGGQIRTDWINFLKQEINPEYIHVETLADEYRTWLKKRYKTTENINKTFNIGFKKFEEIALPVSYSDDNIRKGQDWLEFIRKIDPEVTGLPGHMMEDYRRYIISQFTDGKGQVDFKGISLAFKKKIMIDQEIPFYNVYPSSPSVSDQVRDLYRKFILLPQNEQHRVIKYPGKVKNQWSAFLSGKYKNDIQKLNKAWSITCSDWNKICPPTAEFEWFQVLDNRGMLIKEYLKRNYVMVFDTILTNGYALKNTVIYCLLAVLAALLVNPLCAYGLSRYKMAPAYKILLFLMLPMAFPAMVLGIPQFLLIKKLGLLNTFGALILPGLANGYMIFLLKGFFDSLPKELFESAALDGASEPTVFWHIAMGLSTPILSVLALNTFTAAYGNFMMAFLLCQDKSMWTMMVYLYQLQQYSSQAVSFAALIIAAIPTLLVFIFCQNIIIKGIVVPSEK